MDSDRPKPGVIQGSIEILECAELSEALFHARLQQPFEPALRGQPPAEPQVERLRRASSLTIRCGSGAAAKVRAMAADEWSRLRAANVATADTKPWSNTVTPDRSEASSQRRPSPSR